MGVSINEIAIEIVDIYPLIAWWIGGSVHRFLEVYTYIGGFLSHGGTPKNHPF